MSKGKVPALKGIAALVAVLAVALGSAGAASAALASASGSAFGAAATVLGVVQLGPTPTITNPAPGGGGGTVTTAFIGADGVTAQAATVSSTGDVTTGPSSSATLTGVNVTESTPILGAALALSATTVQSTCTVSTSGVPSGGVTLVGLSGTLLTIPITLSATPAPNTVVQLTVPNVILGGPPIVVGTITLNEQLISGSSITVNAVHIVLSPVAGLTNGTDIILSSSSCSASTFVAVNFRSLSASASKSGVAVRWSTASEIDMAGFNVYRQIHGRRVRVNHRIIAAASRSGHRYSFLDRSLRGNRAAGARYYIQAINLDGSRSWFGPARVLSGRTVS